MLSQAQLRDELIKLLSNEISLDQFDEWFAQNSWNVHRSGDLLAQRLAYAIELRLAEYDEEHLPEADLRKELLDLLNHVQLQINSSYQTSSAINNVSSQPWAFQSFDTSLSKAS